ncbi:tyrosine-type recombinase/integrase [Tundrisphaera sp. TA3]|uniref:tyrosine-type recombinase/integrase n=1 Tax=Tundrisphaera sp. TA3 TaxID=3435775 RepID=UPI003EB70150
MRHPEPWYRKFNDTWYVQLDGKQQKLAKGKDNKPEAFRTFHRLMAGQRVGTPKAISASVLCYLYLEWSREEHKPATQEWYRGQLDSFRKTCGKIEASAVTPSDVSRWLAARKKLAVAAKRQFGPSSKRAAITAIKAVWSWAVKNHHLEKNPLKDIERPAMRRRRALTAAEMAAIFEAVPDRAFRDFLRALRLTGARPGEVAGVTAADVKGDTWVLQVHKTDSTGEDRIIYLNEEMQELSARRAKLHPDGPIFRQHRGGRPWNRNAIRCRFRRLRAKLGLEAGAVCYGIRHAFVTDALEKGVPVATVAQLVGHRDLKMIQQTYSHLNERQQHLRDAARLATEN